MPETRHDVLIEPGGGETITDREGREVVLLTGREEITITRYRMLPASAARILTSTTSTPTPSTCSRAR
jgi:hypothetical protein